ncbi:helix-turn-helix domain-containing protein [Roseivivax sp. GX 12232]|uniref:helix-turn-helix domain-containing protein n=1 Tax=Roseivivax sp. GX 12232 TaxID=2900547 RepID=UPI001E592A4B|nr:helix-turn-helix domain-containing protein [Roseivivax sp. GX 12232]MCE0505390.1 helix-turn-helix domain-containing protein [Roseivivax sp. GX 12232]
MIDLPYPSDATFLTVNEVAELFRTTPKTVRRWIKNRDLPATQIGRGWRIARSDLKQLAADRGNGAIHHAL